MFGGEKAFYKSKGLWAGLIIAALSVYGVDYDGDLIKSVNDNIDNIMTLSLSLIAIYGRLMASKALTVAPMAGTPSNYVPSGPNVVSAAVQPALAAGVVDTGAVQLQMYTVPANPQLPVDETIPKG